MSYFFVSISNLFTYLKLGDVFTLCVYTSNAAKCTSNVAKNSLPWAGTATARPDSSRPHPALNTPREVSYMTFLGCLFQCFTTLTSHSNKVKQEGDEADEGPETQAL